MILTGQQIRHGVAAGEIVVDPFCDAHVQPNSYDFRLGSKLLVYDALELDARIENPVREIQIGPEGHVLQPGRIYLGHTLEVMGSELYVPIIRARSSVARLGLFVHVTADLIDIGSINQWTLQLNPVHPVRVYSGMRVGQVTFWVTKGPINLYCGKYQGSRGPQASKAFADFTDQPQESQATASNLVHRTPTKAEA